MIQNRVLTKLKYKKCEMNLTLRIHSSVITLQQWELSISSLNLKLNFLRKFQFYLILNYRQIHDIFHDIHSAFKYLIIIFTFIKKSSFILSKRALLKKEIHTGIKLSYGSLDFIQQMNFPVPLAPSLILKAVPQIAPVSLLAHFVHS